MSTNEERSIPVVAMDINLNIVYSYSSYREATKHLESLSGNTVTCGYSNIANAIKNRTGYRGFYWDYKNESDKNKTTYKSETFGKLYARGVAYMCTDPATGIKTIVKSVAEFAKRFKYNLVKAQTEVKSNPDYITQINPYITHSTEPDPKFKTYSDIKKVKIGIDYILGNYTEDVISYIISNNLYDLTKTVWENKYYILEALKNKHNFKVSTYPPSTLNYWIMRGFSKEEGQNA